MDEIKKCLIALCHKFGIGTVDIEKSETSVEERVSIEVVYEPDVKDAHGEWMSAETIRSGQENFNKYLGEGIVKSNLLHAQDTDGFTVEKSWINEEMDIIVEGSEEKVKAGAWLAKIRYHDDRLWNAKKAGALCGVSISCKGDINDDTGEITNLDFSGESDADSKE